MRPEQVIRSIHRMIRFVAKRVLVSSAIVQEGGGLLHTSHHPLHPHPRPEQWDLPCGGLSVVTLTLPPREWIQPQYSARL